MAERRIAVAPPISVPWGIVGVLLSGIVWTSAGRERGLRLGLRLRHGGQLGRSEGEICVVVTMVISLELVADSRMRREDGRLVLLCVCNWTLPPNPCYGSRIIHDLGWPFLLFRRGKGKASF
jgi:hypothetical protein